MPCFCTRNRWTPEQANRQQRKNDDVQGVEAGQRVAGDVFSAASQQQQLVADHGNRANDCGSHAGGEKRQLVPGQQVAAEAEGQEQPNSRMPVTQVISRGRR